MANQPFTAAKKPKEKYTKFLQLFRVLCKSSNAPLGPSIFEEGSASTPGAHDTVPGNNTGSAKPLVLGTNVSSYMLKGLTSPETNPTSTSTAEPVLEHSQTEASDWKAPPKDTFKVAGRFLQTLLKKSPQFVDSNPVKIALSIIKTIIEIKDDFGDNKEQFARGLRETEALLESLEVIAVPEAIRRNFNDFKQKIRKERENFEELARKLITTQILDHEEYKRRIGEIFQNIDKATTSFQVAMEINSQIKESQIHDDIKKAALERLNPSTKADHRTVLECHMLKREECTAGTRVKILKQITDWANDHSSDSDRVFWLAGQAGSGKTTIAYTIAKRFESDGDVNNHTSLGANFFCSRQFQETRVQTRILPTIAYQLAHKCKLYADALHIADKFSAANHDIATQLKDLLVGPWQHSKVAHCPELPTYLIIIDALDEIEGNRGSSFLRNLLVEIDKCDIQGLKFLVTGRSDPQLVKLCKDFISEAVYRLQDVPVTEAKSDIETYLEDKVPMLSSKPELTKLVLRADGLFIYAATAVRYLTLSHSLTGEEQIEMLRDFLSRESASASSATSLNLIDEFYRQIMWDAFSHLDKKILARRLRILHTCLCTAERTSTSIVAGLIPDGSNETAQAVLRDLHAVLYIQDDRVFWYHSSFPDFIFDQARSNFRIGEKDFEFWCDEQTHHKFLAQSCLRVMESGLRFNMGNIPSSFLFDRDNIALSEQVNQTLTPILRYSCGHWAHHLALLGADTDLCFYLSDFLHVRVLFWIEAMNLVGLRDCCTPMLQRARLWVLKDGNNALDLARNIGEAANFATYFTGSPAAESTPHLYISALATWSQDSSLSQKWKKNFSRIPFFTHTTGGFDVPLMTIPVGSRIGAVAFSSNGIWVLSGSSDNSVRVWDASTGAERKVLNGHTNMVSAAAFSSDGVQIVSGSYDQSVRVWDALTGAERKVLNGHTNMISSVAFSGDGTQIVSGSYDKSVRVWDVLTGVEKKVLNGHTNVIFAVAFSSDGTRIVSGAHDNSVRVWDTSTGVAQKVLNHSSSVFSVAFSSDGTHIVSGSFDNSVRVWYASTGAEQKVLNGHTGSVASVAFSTDGTRIVSGSYDKSVRVWDVLTGVVLKVLNGHTGLVFSVAFSSDGMRIVSGSADKCMQVWDALTSVQKKMIKGHTSLVSSIAFSSDGSRIASGSYDKSVRVWDALTGAEQKVLNGHTGLVFSVAFSNEGTRIVSGSYDKSVRVWDALTGADT